MNTFTAISADASAVAFVALALAVAWQWSQERTRQRLLVALSTGDLAAVTLLQLANVRLGYPSPWLTRASVLLFLLSGHLLLRFRHELIPLRPATLRLAAAATAVTFLLILAARFPAAISPTPTPFQSVATLALVLTWTLSVGEPCYRFWRASRTRPAVQRARLRNLSLGYGAIILILLLQATPRYATDLRLAAAVSILQLAVPALLYVSFSPPAALRATWRAHEEEEFSQAIEELLLFTPDRHTLAERALIWAMRLVGAEGGLVADASGPLASADLDEHTAQFLLALSGQVTRQVPLPRDSGLTALIVPLSMAPRPGALAVVSGPFTPFFGADEVGRLEEYAAAIAAALERIELTEALRLSDLELRALNSQLERRVQARSLELEASNRELEAFSYTVSHDLRAPLRAIDGFTRILIEDHSGGIPGEAARYLRMVTDSVGDMNRLIDGLLAFSRLGRQAINVEELQPRDLVDRVIATIRPSLGNRQVAFTVGDLPPFYGDRVLLEQVYANLIGNAVKFTSKAASARVEVGVEDADGLPVYFVKDNGVGFDMRYADKLFGVFQRLHRPEDFEGSGAGLAITQRIVARHGGRIWAESEPGKGAIFRFTIAPVSALTTPSAAAGEVWAPADNRSRIVASAQG